MLKSKELCWMWIHVYTYIGATLRRIVNIPLDQTSHLYIFSDQVSYRKT